MATEAWVRAKTPARTQWEDIVADTAGMSPEERIEYIEFLAALYGETDIPAWLQRIYAGEADPARTR